MKLIVMFAVALALAAPAAAAESGAAVFATKCAACHGAKGEGARFAPRPIAGTPEDWVRTVIRDGKGRKRPVKGLSEAQSAAVAKFVAGL